MRWTVVASNHNSKGWKSITDADFIHVDHIFLDLLQLKTRFLGLHPFLWKDDLYRGQEIVLKLFSGHGNGH